VEGLCTRIDVYKHAGYFDPGQADELKALARRSSVSHPPAILRRFARRYARGGRGPGPAGEVPRVRPAAGAASRPGSWQAS
jgi:GMP synthase (glutamine-hydrolysing)